MGNYSHHYYRKVFYSALFMLGIGWVWISTESLVFAENDPKADFPVDCGHILSLSEINRIAKKYCSGPLRLTPDLVENYQGDIEDSWRYACIGPIHAAYQINAQLCAGILAGSQRINSSGVDTNTSSLNSRQSMQLEQTKLIETAAIARRVSIAYQQARSHLAKATNNELMKKDQIIYRIREVIKRPPYGFNPQSIELLRTRVTTLDQESNRLQSKIQARFEAYFLEQEDKNRDEALALESKARAICNSVDGLNSSDGKSTCDEFFSNTKKKADMAANTDFVRTGTYVRTQGNLPPSSPNPNVDTPDQVNLRNQGNVLGDATDVDKLLGTSTVTSTTTTATTTSAGAAAMAEKVKGAVLKLNSDSSLGSGFVVAYPDGSRAVVTAVHVLEPVGGDPNAFRLTSETDQKLPFSTDVPIGTLTRDTMFPKADFTRIPSSQIPDLRNSNVTGLAIGDVFALQQGDSVYLSGYPGEVRYGEMVTVECKYQGFTDQFQLMAHCDNSIRNLQGISGGVWTNSDGKAIATVSAGQSTNSTEPTSNYAAGFGTPLFLRTTLDDTGRAVYSVGAVPAPPDSVFFGSNDRTRDSIPCMSGSAQFKGGNFPQSDKNCNLIYYSHKREYKLDTFSLSK